MDLHDFEDVADNYDLYSTVITDGNSALGNEATISFHLDLAKRFGQDGILDIGCGTGLTTIPLAKSNFNIIGIDISNPMIKKLLSKAKNENLKLNAICSNMTNFNLRKDNSLAFITRTGFMHLLTSEEQKKCLLTINKHLKRKGILTLNTSYPSHEALAKFMQSKIDDFSYRLEYKNVNGNMEKLYCSNTYDPESQIITGQWLFEEYQNNKIIDKRTRPLSIRTTFKNEMEYLFELSGFKVKDVFGDYQYNKPKYPGWIIWVVEKI